MVSIAVRRREVVAEQLQAALESRVLIEQAKGVLAERHQITVEKGFELMRAHARRKDRKLVEVAGLVIEGRLTLDPS